jgi:hypothetical protein
MRLLLDVKRIADDQHYVYVRYMSPSGVVDLDCTMSYESFRFEMVCLLLHMLTDMSVEDIRKNTSYRNTPDNKKIIIETLVYGMKLVFPCDTAMDDASLDSFVQETAETIAEVVSRAKTHEIEVVINENWKR